MMEDVETEKTATKGHECGFLEQFFREKVLLVAFSRTQVCQFGGDHGKESVGIVPGAMRISAGYTRR